MAKLVPYIFSEDAHAQGNYYAEVLRGEIVNLRHYSDLPDMPQEMQEKVLHLELRAGDLKLYMADTTPARAGNRIDLTLECGSEEEGAGIFDKLAREGKVIFPFGRMPWGALLGRVEDRFGITWQIAAD